MRTNERKWPRRRQRPFLSSPSRIGARFCLGRQLPLYLRTGFFFYQSTTGWVGAESAGTTRLAYRVLGWSRIRGHDKVGVSGGGVIVNRREMDRPPADLCRRALAFRPTWRVGEGSSRLNRATLQPTILYTYAPSISSIQNSTVHAATASVLPTALL
jgi:hypothetical protein